jgi:hypothetical protein
MELLAETYRRIKVFVTFPSMSNVLVAKVLESMACGCSLVAPKQPIDLQGYYPYSGAYDCVQQIRTALHVDSLNKSHEVIISNHRMELRFNQIFEKVGICVSSSPGLAVLSAIT